MELVVTTGVRDMYSYCLIVGINKPVPSPALSMPDAVPVQPAASEPCRKNYCIPQTCSPQAHLASSILVFDHCRGTGISGLMRGLATLPQGGSRSLQWSETGMEDPKCTASVCVAGVYCWGMEWMAWKTPSVLLLCV